MEGSRMMREIKPVDYIIANQLGYLDGNIVALITEWRLTRDVKVLEQAQQEINNLLERERFMEDRLKTYTESQQGS
tara:strand:+ start:637 stop:864 length:228 start_codon:yes stop_codon:yes gene_type:complete